MNTPAGALAIHNSTKHGTPPAHPELLVRYLRLDPRNAPTAFKVYRSLPVSPLPRALVASVPSAVSVLSGRSGDPSPIDAGLVATLLFLAAGVTRTASGTGRRIFFRAAMSAGNLHPVEVYAVVGPGVDGISAGVYHFAPREFGLTPLRAGEFGFQLGVSTPLALVLTGLVWRTAWKYGERSWRHLYWDAGCVLANLLSVAEAHGLDPRILVGFDDQRVSRLVGIDGMDEMPLAVVALGPEKGVELGPPPDLSPVSPEVDPVAPHPFRLPLLVEAQNGSTLEAREVVPWRRAAVGVTSEAPVRVDPPPAAAQEGIEAVILRRGSTRVMLRESVVSEALQWPMAAASRAVPMDAAPRGTLLEHYANVHAVEGFRPGAYRWGPGVPELVAALDSPREMSALLCLDQPLGGDSAYTVFHSAHLGPLIDLLGSRGYRAAQLEAGIVSGRLALCAFALGLGATGLTFFDDLVSRFFETTSAPMLVTSVGVPGTVPAPSGRPGEPANLRR